GDSLRVGPLSGSCGHGRQWIYRGTERAVPDVPGGGPRLQSAALRVWTAPAGAPGFGVPVLNQVVLEQCLVDSHPRLGTLGSGHNDELRRFGCIARDIDAGNVGGLAAAGVYRALGIEEIGR